MSDQQLTDPPRPGTTPVQVSVPTDVGGRDLSTAGVEHMFSAISNMSEVTEVASVQRSEKEVQSIVASVEEQLTQLALSNESLVHSATNVFKELRYYDAIRLRQYAEHVYNQLLKMVGETPTVPMVVKGNMPLFSNLSFPLVIDSNVLPTQLTVSIFHKAPVIEIVIDVNDRQGKNMSFASRFKYN